MRKVLIASETLNVVSMYDVVDGINYVSGKVKHIGRKHTELLLKGWYKPVPNTSTRSFTITGDVN